ncbi:MAG: hypothetical protein FWF96_05985 [Kiritimatiellaeota bacterium]|nr:hypothetical protein [Kiritimatiellota bacterium]
MKEENPRTFDEQILALCGRDPRFPRGAYEFCLEVLDFSLKAAAEAGDPARGRPVTRHVTARELLDGLRDYALQEFGPMARLTLKRMGVTSCPAFGDIVFNLVGAGLLTKQPRDRREDFETGYDFDTAFGKPFRPASSRKQPKRNTP